MFYTIKMPWVIRKMYPALVWEKPTDEKILYLTFDDGPHPEATPYVLDALKRFNAKATFFCIGKNVAEYPVIYRNIIEEGHRVGNHTYDHLNGWKTKDALYIQNVFEAAKYIDSDLFRPPYGRITKFQARLLQQNDQHTTIGTKTFKIVMWSLLSGDFDIKLSSENCLQNIILNAGPGNIIVFHDSSKAWERMSYALPKVLEYFSNKGYRFLSL
jgi:peptidoglycan/xylan/chitin deacetylase (PgdA/CDA1 family)